PREGGAEVQQAASQPRHRGFQLRAGPRGGRGVKFGVVVFPGTWSDRDCGWVIDQVLDAELRYLWHKDTDLEGCDCVILPGGFSYGDHLRPGAVARFSPIMSIVIDFADAGRLVWAIGNR